MTSNGAYKMLQKTENLNYCAYLNGKARANFFTKWLVFALRSAMPEVIHPCPYFGKTKALYKLPRALELLCPAGMYKGEMYFSTAVNKKNILIGKFITEFIIEN
jgi:hypothetical protein